METLIILGIVVMVVCWLVAPKAPPAPRHHRGGRCRCRRR